MKTPKTVIAGLIALAFINTASAQTVIRITGAQAFGTAVHAAIAHLLGATGNPPYTLGAGNTYAYTGTDITKAQETIWTGTIGGNPVVIKTSYNGSTAGIRIVTQNATVNWLPTGITQSIAGTQNASTASPEVTVADGTVADTFQSSTQWTSPTLIDKVVGAGAYIFVASKQAPGTLTNITNVQAQALYNVGNLPLAVFTSLASDRTTLVNSTFGDAFFGAAVPVQVYATGRDPESGARVVSLIETGIGANTAIQQYKPVISSGNVTNQTLYPASTLNGQPLAEGNDGNTSNGNLATTVLAANTLSGIGGYYISYLPSLDASNAVNAGAHALSYNGIAYTPTAVQEGSYTLWAYEHVFYRSDIGTPKTNALISIANQLLMADASVLISTLQVSRPVDGGIITNTY